jgi:hypothetical protein
MGDQRRLLIARQMEQLGEPVGEGDSTQLCLAFYLAGRDRALELGAD